MKDTIWVTKDKRVLLVSEMETSHILNAIAMIRRRGNWRREYLDRLMIELTIRALKLK